MAKAAKPLPPRPIERLLEPIGRFLHIQAASGIILLACTAVALVLANSPWAHAFAEIWETHVALAFGAFELEGHLGHLVINDGLMTIFFFVVGLEIKREIVLGELSSIRKALLPMAGALGGMIAPAIVYLAFQWGEPGQRGWAVPMATDIAFVVGFLALFGSRVPSGLKIFLLSLAIADDLGAVLIIAFVFTESIAWGWLAAAAAGFVLTFLFNRIGVRAVTIYVIMGAFIWLAFLRAGVHPTVAGVLLGLLTPASAWLRESTFMEEVKDFWLGDDDEDFHPAEQPGGVQRLEFVAREAISPLYRLENALHPWVAFVIMPVFALANAGVPIEKAALTEPVAIAVAAGLVIGKPVGILLACAIAIGLQLSSLPSGVTWKMFIGGACLAGIGFTMALFLNGLAFPPDTYPQMAAAGKIGTLTGSTISAVLGAILLWMSFGKTPAAEAK